MFLRSRARVSECCFSTCAVYGNAFNALLLDLIRLLFSGLEERKEGLVKKNNS